MTDFNDLRFSGAADQPIAASLPLVDINSFTPPALGGRGERRDPVIVNAGRAAKSLENKYAGYMAEIQGQYDQRVVNAMIAYDSDRVRRGQSPLSEEQTRRALDTARTGEAQTPAEQPSVLNLPGNAIRNIGDIVKSIPKIPAALVNEVTSVGDIGQSIEDAPNAIAGLAGAPIIRMLPGAYIAENLAAGTPGELARNPVFTALDILPIAGKVAAGTRLGTEAAERAAAVARGELSVGGREAARLAKMERRPLSAVMTNKFDAEGNIVRNNLGEFIDEATQSRMIRPLHQWFSQGERDVMYAVNAAGQRVHNIVTGVQAPKGTLDELGREAFRLREDLLKMDPTIEQRLPDITRRMQTGDMDGLSVTDMRAFEKYRDMMQRVTKWSVENNYHVMYGGEVYDVGTGYRLRSQAAKIADMETMAGIRSRLLGGDVDAQAALGELRQMSRRPGREPAVGKRQTADKLADLDAGVISQSQLETARQLTIESLRAGGYDLDAFMRDHVTKRGNQTRRMATGDDFWNTVDEVIEGRVVLPKRELLSMEQIMQVIRDNKPLFDGTSLTVLERGLANGEWKVVSEALQSLRKQKGNPALNDPVFVESIRRMRESAKVLDKTKQFSDESVTKARRKLERDVASKPPARFIPEVDRQTRARVKEQLLEIHDPADAQRILSLADTGQWSQIPGWDDRLFRTIQRETAASWQTMRDQGFDPLFVHTVPVHRINRVLYPAEGVIPRSPSSVKERMMDMTPGIQDFTIAASDQMIEYLSRREVEVAVKHIMDMKGETEAALRARFAPMAEARAARSSVKDFEGHLQDIMTERFRRFDPIEEGYNWGSPYLNRLQQDSMWIPQSTYKNLKALADPKTIAGGLFDPITKTFRIATVGLSLRTQIYNIIGGAVAAEMQSPGVLLRQSGRIREYLDAKKAGGLGSSPAWFDDSLREMIGSQKQSMMQLDDIAQGRVTEGVANYLRGKKMRGWWDDIQARKQPGRPMDKFRGKVQGLAEKMYDLNGLFDDMYRMVTYYDSYDKALAKGATNKAAAEAAIGQTRKVLQDWMGMTPMERSVMKSLVPFYGFMSYAMRFVMSYPMDHPLRAEMISKLAQAEMEDMNALPTRFMSNWFIGGMDAEGGQNALNLAPINPYGEVANMLTLEGFLGATNPAINTMFQMVGLDQGQAELYPSLRYDPETGRLGAKRGNPILALLENTIPQSSLVTSVLGVNDQFNETLQRDPAAANRLLLSSLTVPILWRKYNVPQEQFKAEVARMETEQVVLNQALKTGDWSEALRYPSLAAYLDALDAMPDQDLAAYRGLSKDQAAEIARSSMAGRPPGLPSVPVLDDVVKAQMDQVGLLGGQVAGVGIAAGGSGLSGGQGGAEPPIAGSLANTSSGGI